MWILLLVTMVSAITRKRSKEQDSGQLKVQSTIDGSSSENVHQRTRKRNLRSSNIDSNVVAVEPIPQPDANEHPDANQSPIDPPKRRGRSLNRSATKTLETLPEGSKISLTMANEHDKKVKKFVGTSATQFATECGIVMRNICPMNFHKWESIPSDVMERMYEKLQAKFNLLRADRVFMAYVDDHLHRQWRRTRGKLSAHWKQNGGRTNPHLARSNMDLNCRSPEDWNHLCDYWELESTQKYSIQMEANRQKQRIASRGGSRSIVNHVFHMTNCETQTHPTPFEVYHKLHFNAEKQGWLSDDARIQYENIIRHKEEAVAKLTVEGTTITPTMHHELEKEAIQSVCAKEKTKKSAWMVGVGPVLRKKDFWMTSEPQSSQQPSSEAETLRNQVASLQEKLKQSNEKYDKLSIFMSSKFPDFEGVASTAASSGATYSEEQLNDDVCGNDSLI